MKANSSFRMEKETKMVMAGIVDPVERGEYKRAMIEAQLAAEAAKRRPLAKDKEEAGE